MGAVLGSVAEIKDLKNEIAGLRTDLKRFIERANQQHIETVLGELRKNYSGLFADHQVDCAKTGLSEKMVSSCPMRDKCFSVFMEFLENTAGHIRDRSVSEEVISSCREEMQNLRSKGTGKGCDTCFAEVYRLFEKQVDLMQSLGIYERSRESAASSAPVPEDRAVKGILEPVANVQRMQILQALSVQTRTFSELSGLTGLRGGNLLFHVKKLADTGMILQRHERGDYIITEKGFLTLRAVADLYRTLNPTDNIASDTEVAVAEKS
ncbi:MAG: winged helix-turn-helix domain-containing protein [Methanoregula sp.]|jgi:DNA-binding transcriptional ArsR family regulator